MPITCDDCGKEANYKDMPAGGRWIEWMSDPSRGDAAVVAVPCDEGVISCVCMPCLQKTIDSMAQESLPDNVEVTGAARLYRAASVWTAGLAASEFHRDAKMI